jgi:hypothetical protein
MSLRLWLVGLLDPKSQYHDQMVFMVGRVNYWTDKYTALRSRNEELEAYVRKNKAAIQAAHAILEAARPLVLNLERLKDANKNLDL